MASVSSSVDSFRTHSVGPQDGTLPSARAPQSKVTPLKEDTVALSQAKFLFPKPTGEFPIGIQSYVVQEGNRPIGISIHYPSEKGTSFRRHPLKPYFEDLRTLHPNMETACFESCCSYAQPNTAPHRGAFPVVLMGHGLGMSSDDYQPIVEELASHGFIVVTVESPGVAGYSRGLDSQGKPAILNEEKILKDDRAVQLQIQDIESVLKILYNFSSINPELAASLDLDRVGVMGHSLGGAAAAQVCRNNARIRAGMNLDGRLLGENATGSIFQPFVTIQSDRFATVLENLLPDVKASLGLIRQDKAQEAATDLEKAVTAAENFLDPIDEFDAFHQKTGRGSYQLVLKGSRHAGFSSLHLLGAAVGLAEVAGSDHPQKAMYQNWNEQIPDDLRTWAATNRHVVSFFSEQLKGIPSQVRRNGKIEESI